LGPSAPLSRSEAAQRAEQLASSDRRAEEVQSVDADASSEGGADPIAELRAKMAALMNTEPSTAVPPIQGAARASTLPFQEVEMHGGTISQRLETQRASSHVGKMPLSAAADANGAMLSLLALDPSLSDLDYRRALYFDTETTGLGGAGALAFLVGLAWFDDEGCLVLEQLLLKSPSEESVLLARFAELAARSSMLVSFNGKSFDWPLLQGRRIMNRLPELEKLPHLDLLHLSRRIHKRRLSSCRLIRLEMEVLGWDRGEDDIPGADIPARYSHFLRTGDEEALRDVIDHNAWDVLTMAALVGLYGEPLDLLEGEDLLGVTQTLTRAKAFDEAEAAAERALRTEHETDALELRARLMKARGDKARALLDFESLSKKVDEPGVRLELAKLFEHHEKDFEKALSLVAEGTGEDEDALEKRRARLQRRHERQTERRLSGDRSSARKR